MSGEDVHRFILDKLSELRCTEAQILEQEMARNGGDLDIDSEEGASIAYGLEGTVGRRLVEAQDIKRENFISVQRLSSLLLKNLNKSSKEGVQKNI